MLTEGTKIEFASGRRFEVLKYHGDEKYDIKLLDTQLKVFPSNDYSQIFHEIKLVNYKLINN